MKSVWGRFGVFVALFVTTLIGCFVFSNPETNPVAGVVMWLPEELPNHYVVDQKMSPLERKWLPDDTSFIKRVYLEQFQPKTEALERALFATLIVAGSDSRSLHRPKVCLRGQHWTITKKEVVTLETKGGPLEVMDFHLEKFITGADNRPVYDQHGQRVKIRAHYVYWWIGPGVSTASDEERVWLELWNSLSKGRKERWAYPSVHAPVDERYGREEAQKRAYDFVREFAPQFQKSLGAQEKSKNNDIKFQ